MARRDDCRTGSDEFDFDLDFEFDLDFGRRPGVDFDLDFDFGRRLRGCAWRGAEGMRVGLARGPGLLRSPCAAHRRGRRS
jgi:hypothetical protein